MRQCIGALSALVLAGISVPGSAQQILLDEPVRAGELTFFRALDDPQAYYYVPDQIHLARRAGGAPQFSFLRYAQSVRGTAGAPAPREAGGGGIVHAVIEMAVPEAVLDEATRELRRLRTGARVAGPVVFRTGRFGLVSSFANEEGELTHRVVGLGSAPILEGSRAAVSLHLTALGARLLWQSFHMPTPDVSFLFEMEMAGFRAPLRATLEADFERIYEHRAFSAAVATPQIAAEIRDTFDELRSAGAIRLEAVGEDPHLDQLVDYAYRKLTEVMFQPATDSPWSGLEGESLLDKATARLAAEREAVRERNRQRLEQRRQLREAAHRAAADRRAQSARVQEALAADDAAELTDEERASLRALGDYLDARAAAEEDRAEIEDPPAPVDDDELPEDEALPEFSAMAVYELRRTRRRDTYRIDLSQSLPDTLPITFAENIGDLRRHLDDPDVFRDVQLDDPLFRQREIAVIVDGANADDFAQTINFVTVELRKLHQGGEVTHDEVRIDRASFNRDANAARLLYGWKGDGDRERWLEYEVRETWSYFGGYVAERPWRAASAPAVAVVPPYAPTSVMVEAPDPATLRERGVRAVTASVFYDLGGNERSDRLTLTTGGEILSGRLEVLLPRDRASYDYQIDWRLSGDRRLTTGRRTTESSLLFVDELPASGDGG